MIKMSLSSLLLLLLQLAAPAAPSNTNLFIVDASVRQVEVECPYSGHATCSDKVDNDHDGDVDEAAPAAAFNADGANYFTEGENCLRAGSITSASDAVASGGAYLHNPSGQTYNAGAFACSGNVTNTTYAAWMLVKNPGAPARGHISTSSIVSPDNATQGWTIPTLPNYSCIPVGTAGTNANFANYVNGTAQRSFALSGNVAIWGWVEPGPQIDRVILTPNLNADPGTICSSSAAVVQYEMLEIGAHAEQVDAVVNTWNTNATQFPFSPTAFNSTSGNGPPNVRFAWDNAATDRMCVIATIPDNDLRSTNVANDDGSIFSNDSIEIVWRKDLTRSEGVSGDTFKIILDISSTQAHLDRSPVNAIDNLYTASITKARAISGNLDDVANDTSSTIEACFNMGFAATPDQLILMNVRINDRDAAFGYRDASGVVGSINSMADWITVKLSSSTIPASTDTTNPTVASCTAENIGTTSFQAQCRPDDDSNLPMAVRVKYGTNPGVYTTTVAGGSCNDNTLCAITIPNLTPGQSVFWRYCVVDPAGNPTDQTGNLGCSDEIGTPIPASSGFFVRNDGIDSGNNCINPSTPCSFSRLMANSGVRPTAGQTWFIRNHTTNGDYPSLNYVCPSSNPGQPGSPITIKAEFERQVRIRNTSSNALLVSNCSYVNFEGLRLAEAASNEGVITVNNNSQNITLHRILITGTDAVPCNDVSNPACFTKKEGIHILDSANVTVSETEIYNWQNYAIKMYHGAGGHRITKVYCHRRDSVGAFHIANYPASNNLVENVICESWQSGGNFLSGSDTANNRYYNFISKITQEGFSYGVYAGGGPGGYGHNLIVENLLEIVQNGNGPGGQAANNMVARNVTSIGPSSGTPSGNGQRMTASATPPSGGGQFTCINCLAMTANVGMTVVASAFNQWSLQNPATYNVNTPYSPAGTDPNITGEVALNSTNGNIMLACPTFVRPTATQLFGQGVAGANIGASILYEYVNGKQTTNQLWVSSTREINTSVWGGAIISGVNDSGTPNSKANVGQRLNSGCTSGWPY